ncbi:hypothetical protein DF052_06990 [Burkholderia glumae]|uniref:hypothetical protein n=1 Tax=Burkholderia glumae TaxID=337 RepID=UPI000F5E240E|nr:hypothetical protein [Burkholderia glumae]RQZ74824.1 hypothetical protein DF052_06990 [Burkholderia glumae]
MFDRNLTPATDATDDAGRAFQFFARVSALSFIALLAGLVIPLNRAELVTWTIAVLLAALACVIVTAAILITKEHHHG